MIKRSIFYFLMALLFAACTSSETYMQRGQYDAAINKAKRKLVKKPSKESEAIVLERAFKKANQKDKDYINFLKKEGRPDNWDQIFSVYTRMKNRQNNIRSILPLRIASQNRNAEFEFVDYDNEIIHAKKRAAEYYYANGLRLLQSGDKMNARKAYQEFQRVKKFYSSYKDVDQKLNEARASGTSYVIYQMVNKSIIPLPKGFEDELTKISLTDLNSQWVVYDVIPNNNINYDYTILVNMKNISVSPEGVKEGAFENTKEIEDGWQYVLDKRGNVQKDTAGNDMKVPKYKTITCRVVETKLYKRAVIAGSLDFIDNRTKQIIKTDPIMAESIFDYSFATAVGSIEALKPEHRAKLNNKPMPFPPTPQMILDAGQTLKNMVKDIIHRNKNVII